MNKTCPLLKKPCIENQCMLWQPMNYQKPGEEVVVLWNCSLNWMVEMQLEANKQLRGTAASMDKVANEINAGAGSALLSAMGVGQQRKLR